MRGHRRVGQRISGAEREEGPLKHEGGFLPPSAGMGRPPGAHTAWNGSLEVVEDTRGGEEGAPST